MVIAIISPGQYPERGDNLPEKQRHIDDNVCVEDELAEGVVELRAELPSHEDDGEETEYEMRAHAYNIEWEELFDDLFEIEYHGDQANYYYNQYACHSKRTIIGESILHGIFELKYQCVIFTPLLRRLLAVVFFMVLEHLH